MNILVLDLPLFVQELREAGHTVVNIGPDPACAIHLPAELYTLAEIWKRLPAGFEPQCLLVSESLKRRRFPRDIAAAPCATLWYSIDGHLHLDWHRVYARLFDRVLCSQLSVCDSLQGEGLCAHWLPWSVPGKELATGHGPGSRTITVGMVGSFHAGQRPKRRQLLERLARRYPLTLLGPPFTPFLSGAEQAAVYRKSRIVLNECIGGELNFRLLEAAAQGACVLSEQGAEGQDLVLRPGSEFVPYRGDTIEAELEALLADPARCARIGQAALERVAADHTRTVRCGQLLEILERTRVDTRRRLLAGVAPRLENWVIRRARQNGLCGPGPAEEGTEDLLADRVYPGELGDELLIDQATRLGASGRWAEAERVLAHSASNRCLLALESGRLLQQQDRGLVEESAFVHSVQMLARVYRTQDRRWRAGILQDPQHLLFPAWEIQLLQAALLRKPEQPGLWLALADCEQACGLVAQAVESLDALVRVLAQARLAVPDGIRLEHARLQWTAHLPEAAEANLLRLHPQKWADAPWLPREQQERLLAIWTLLSGQDLPAPERLERLERLALERPSSPLAGLCCELAERDRQPARALALLERLLGREPGSPRLHTLRGRVLEELGRREESLRCAEQARTCNPLVRHLNHTEIPA
jgi:tetratricopeptide (TPR) repeat protein